jgi:voltage-gated potassium channel
MDAARRQAALDRFERAVEVPLLVLALAMAPLLVAPLVFELSPGAAAAVEGADWFIWMVFAAEYVVRLVLAPDRLVFMRKAWLDLVIVALPFLRPLRLARSGRVVRALRLARVGALVGKGGREGRRFFVRHRLHHALLVEVALLVGAAVLVVAVEGGPGPGRISTFGEALWWSFTTMTTGVGYGADVPTTFIGHGIATFLMLAGIALFGVLTANVAAFFIEGTAESHDDRLDEVLRRLDAIEAALRSDR